MGPDAMILVFWMLSFKPVFSLSVVSVGGLNNRHFFLLQFRRLEAPIQGMGRAVLPLKALGEELPCLSQLLVAPGIPWLWHHNSRFCLHLPRVFNPSPSASVLCLTRMPVPGIRGRLNPEWSYLEILMLITHAKTPSPPIMSPSWVRGFKTWTYANDSLHYSGRIFPPSCPSLLPELQSLWR